MLRWYFSTTFSYSITTEKLTGEESIDWICRRVLDFFLQSILSQVRWSLHAVFCVVVQVLEDVTGEEFVLLMRVLSGLKNLQTVSGRQQLVELVVEQAFLEQALNPADADSVDRLLQCTRQALPLFSVSWPTALAWPLQNLNRFYTARHSLFCCLYVKR